MIFCFLFLAFVEAQRHLSVLNKAVDRCYHSAPAPCPVLCLVLQRPGLKVTCPHLLSSHVLVGSATFTARVCRAGCWACWAEAFQADQSLLKSWGGPSLKMALSSAGQALFLV